MMYVVGKHGSMLNGPFKARYTNIKCIEANSEQDAVSVYNSIRHKGVKIASLSKCVGILDEENRLLIPNFHLNFESAKLLQSTPPHVYNHLVCRLLDEPKNFSEYSIYVPEFIQAACIEDALEAYEKAHPTTQFKAYVLGYLDDNDTFIVPNILDYIA